MIKIFSDYVPGKKSPLFGVRWDVEGEDGIMKNMVCDYYSYDMGVKEIVELLRKVATVIERRL